MKRIGRLIRFIFALIIIFMGVFWLSDHFIEKADGYQSNYIYVLERDTQKVVLEKRAEHKAYPASLAKMMTTIVALENIDDLSAIAPIDVETYKQMVDSGASMAGFYGKETTTYRDLLYGTMLASGGEAANSLAINISGNIEDFVVLMNQKANELGMKDTHFTNVEGLHNRKQVTTARDMAVLLDYCLQNGDFRAIFTKPQFTSTATVDHPNGVVITSTVLSKIPDQTGLDFEIIGGKSGTTIKAGQCWAVLGTKNGKEYISIVMGAEIEDIHSPDYTQIDDTIRIFSSIK